MALNDMSASINDYTIIEDRGGHEDQQLAFLLLIAPTTEQVTEHRHITENRNLGGVEIPLFLENSAEDDGLSIVDQHAGRQLARIDRRHRAASAGLEDFANGILLDRQVQLHPVVRRDQRYDAQFEHGFLELDGGGPGVGGFFIGNFDTLLDEGLGLVGGDHARGRNELTVTLLFQRA